MPPITSKNFEDAVCTLLDSMGMPVEAGRVITDSFDDTWIVTGGAAPHNPHTPGLVWVDHSFEPYSRTFRVDVLGLRWEK